MLKDKPGPSSVNIQLTCIWRWRKHNVIEKSLLLFPPSLSSYDLLLRSCKTEHIPFFISLYQERSFLMKTFGMEYSPSPAFSTNTFHPAPPCKRALLQDQWPRLLIQFTENDSPFLGVVACNTSNIPNCFTSSAWYGLSFSYHIAAAPGLYFYSRKCTEFAFIGEVSTSSTRAFFKHY